MVKKTAKINFPNEILHWYIFKTFPIFKLIFLFYYVKEDHSKHSATYDTEKIYNKFLCHPRENGRFFIYEKGFYLKIFVFKTKQYN